MSAPHRALAAAVGLLALGCSQDLQSPGVTEQPAGLVTAAAAPLAYRQLSAGYYHTCGVTTTNAAYCWGRNDTDQLGAGVLGDQGRPVAVRGGLKFLQLSAGAGYTCGITTTNLAYCWGENGVGQLGDGTTTRRLIPRLVAGGRKYRQIRSGYFHTCAITLADVAFCWGRNSNGQVGDGTTTPRLVPTRVKTTATFRWVFAAGLHSCGATTDFHALCWGRNEDGQLGDGTTLKKVVPTAIAGSRAFRVVTVGAFKGNGDGWNAASCGITTADQTFCWGDNTYGGLGDGTTTKRLTPSPVTGGHSFSTVSVAPGHACALAFDASAWCWGTNGNGELGIGLLGGAYPDPLPVIGGVHFKTITAGTIYTCGVATDDRAYCWGANQFGQLGVGSINTGGLFVPHFQPTAVVGPA
ncbi:MAG: hypothetical protein ABJC36_12180 [Gemmatimonadales bacterium]